MNKKLMVLTVIGLATSCLAACGSNKEYADLVVYGTIYTAEETNNSLAEAFAVKNGKYIYVGNANNVEGYVKNGTTKIIDKRNQGLVIPGCTEGHAHFIGCDALLRQFPGFDAEYETVGDVKGLKDILVDYLTNNPDAKYFISWGLPYRFFYDNHDYSVSYAEEIENLTPGIPVIFLDNDGHQALCNVTALEKAGLFDSKTNVVTVPRGGNVYLTSGENPKPTGWISDELVFSSVNKVLDFSTTSNDIFKNAVKAGAKELNSRGFTNYLDAAINAVGGNEFYPNIKDLDDNNELALNISTCHIVQSPDAERLHEKIDEAKELADTYKSEHFNPYNIKLWIDGVTESRTGWINAAYPNPIEGSDYGNKIWSEDEIKDITKYSNQNGLLVHSHTYGDGAVSATIDAYIYANNELGGKYANSLGHVRNITEEDIRRVADNGITIAENLIWHSNGDFSDDDWDYVTGVINEIMPEGYYETGYPMKSLLDAGINVSSSTDAPASEAVKGNIMNIIEVATTGKNPNATIRAFNPSELLSVKEVLQCLTINGAKQLGIEDKCGSIKENKNADFVILDTNFLDYEGEQLRTIHNTKIENVYFEGNVVYSNTNN